MFDIKKKVGIRLQQATGTLGLAIDSRLCIMVPDEEGDDDPYMEFVSD